MRIASFLSAVCLSSVFMLAADNPYIGTWQLNVAKSTYKPGPAMKEETIRFEPDGEKIRRIANGTDGNGKPIDEGGPEGASFPWDGQFHIVTKPSEKPEVQVSVTVKDPHHLSVKIKVDGKLVEDDRSSISKDGKTLTDVDDGVNMKGEKVHNVEVFERQ
jgi:hypothetical protein